MSDNTSVTPTKEETQALFLNCIEKVFENLSNISPDLPLMLKSDNSKMTAREVYTLLKTGDAGIYSFAFNLFKQGFGKYVESMVEYSEKEKETNEQKGRIILQ